jgi:hypothetical protein
LTNTTDSNGQRPAASEHSWRPRDIVQLATTPPERPLIGGLVYRQKRCALLSGETESLKTWLALILAKAEMDAGYPVAWADVDAMGPADLLDRRRVLGVAKRTIERQFLYYAPEEQLKDGRLDDVRAEIIEGGVRLFVVDAFNPFLNLHGLDPLSTDDVESFWREIADPIAAAGATPTLLDHVSKNAETRGKYSYGSERKASGAIVHIGFRTLEVFGRGRTGRALLTTHKDRPGYLPRPTIGRLALTSDGENVSYELEADRARATDKFRPTHLMERVSHTLERQDGPVSVTWIEQNVQGNVPHLRTAVQVLSADGYLDNKKTPRGSQVTSIRPYREADDDVLKGADDTPSTPRPNPVPELVSVAHDPTPSTRPLLKEDGDGRRSTTPSNDHVHTTSASEFDGLPL